MITALLAAFIVCAGRSATATELGGYGRPLGRSRGGGSGLYACLQKQENPGKCGAVPDAAGGFVEPRVLWGAEIENSGCSEAARAALLARLESAAGIFNSGLLKARSCVAAQLWALDGDGCREAGAEWSRYVAAQRELFVSRWKDGIRTALAGCRPAEGPARPAAGPAAKGSSSAPPMCRELAGEDRARGECEALPPQRQDVGPFEAELMHPDMGSCPKEARDRTWLLVDMFAKNFKFSRALCVVAAQYFLAAQGGTSCAETVAAYESHIDNQQSLFRSRWMRATARTGAACRSAPR